MPKKEESTPCRKPKPLEPKVALVEEICLHPERFDVKPMYQRSDVWTRGKECALIDTYLLGENAGSLLAKKRIDNFKTVYEIIDGHQRISTIQKFYNDGFPTWSNAQKRNFEPNSDPPVEPKRLFSQLSPEATQAFLEGLVVIDLVPEGLTEDQIITRFGRANNHVPLSMAEQLNVYGSKANEVARVVRDHPFWEDAYDGDTKREQVFQCCLYLLSIELSTKRYSDMTVDITKPPVFSLSRGNSDLYITDGITQKIQNRLSITAHLYNGASFTTRAAAIVMYQSIILLEKAGYDTTNLTRSNRARLVPWVNPVIREMKRVSGVAKYGRSATRLLRKEAQREFWRIQESSMLAQLGVTVKKPVLVS